MRRTLIALLAACLAFAAVADARSLVDRMPPAQVGAWTAARLAPPPVPAALPSQMGAALPCCKRGKPTALELHPLARRLFGSMPCSPLPAPLLYRPPPQDAAPRRSLQQSLDSGTVCALIASDPDLASMADAIRPGCALLQSPQARQMIPQLAGSMGLSSSDVNAVLGCVCSGGRRRALAGASTQLTPALVAQLVAQHPELQSLVAAIRPYCSLLSSVDAAGMLAGQGFSPADVQAVLTYICG